MKELLKNWKEDLDQDFKDLRRDIKEKYKRLGKKEFCIFTGILSFMVSCILYKPLLPLILIVFLFGILTLVYISVFIGSSVALTYIFSLSDMFFFDKEPKYFTLRQTISVLLCIAVILFLLYNLESWFIIIDLWASVDWKGILNN